MEKILVLLRQIYPLQIKTELEVNKTTTPVLVLLDREIMIIINIIYRYKLDQVKGLISQIVLDNKTQYHMVS